MKSVKVDYPPNIDIYGIEYVAPLAMKLRWLKINGSLERDESMVWVDFPHSTTMELRDGES